MVSGEIIIIIIIIVYKEGATSQLGRAPRGTVGL